MKTNFYIFQLQNKTITLFLMSLSFQQNLVKLTNASGCQEKEIIQSLWSGYGKISRYVLQDSTYKSVVVKYIDLNQIGDHPRGWNTDISHKRKVKSYEIETHWYKQWSHLCTIDCRVPRFIGSFAKGKDKWIVLEDLNDHFPLRKYKIQMDEVKVCLRWLAYFHATFLGRRPEGLWEVGTYWHLATRPDEWAEMQETTLKQKAKTIDTILNNGKYQTIVHGDAKLANFCFSKDGKKIAAVDFQYVGGGCGMKDVAYFLGSCLSSSECIRHEDELLRFYFEALESAFNKANHDYMFLELETEWRKLYPIACTDFTRFLVGWMPTHQKINKYHLEKMDQVLSTL